MHPLSLSKVYSRLGSGRFAPPPSAERPVTVALTNAVPLNAGDAAILQGVMAILRDALGEDARFVVYGSRSRAARRYYPEYDFRRPVAAHLRSEAPSSSLRRGGRTLLLLAGAWCYGRGLGGLTRPWLAPEVRTALAELASVDVVVATGGTYLVEIYDLRERIVDLGIAVAARRPLILFTQSLGPFERPGNRRALGRILRRARLVLVRDERSAGHLGELGVAPERMAVSADAAFALAPIRPATASEPDGRGERGPRVGVSVREWRHFTDGDEEAGNARYRDAVAGLVERLVGGHDAEVTFLSTCQGVPQYWTDDSEVAADVVGRLRPELRCRVTVDREFRRPDQLIEALANLDLVVATRMHAAILALVAGTPVFPIAYEFKTHELFRRLGQEEWVQDLEDLTAASLTDGVERFLSELPRLRGALFRNVDAERELARQSAAQVRQALGPMLAPPHSAAAPAPGGHPRGATGPAGAAAAAGRSRNGRPRPIVRRVRRERLTYLSAPALEDLWQRTRELEAEGRQGTLIEAGCALGGSAIVMAKAKARTRPLYVYDVFGTIPPPSEKDGRDVQERYEVIAGDRSAGIRGDRYYGYEENLLERVESTFARFAMPVEESNVHLIRGLYEETLIVREPVALAHIDCDWYESVRVCLARIAPRLEPRGVLVIDDYHDWSGCRRAVDEYFADKRGDFRFEERARLHVVRNG